MFKILFLCTLTILVSGKPSTNDGVVPAAVSSVSEPKEETVPVQVLPAEPVLKAAAESQSDKEEIASPDLLKTAEDDQKDDKIAPKPLFLILSLLTTTTTTTTTTAAATTAAATMAVTEATTAATTTTAAPEK